MKIITASAYTAIVSRNLISKVQIDAWIEITHAGTRWEGLIKIRPCIDENYADEINMSIVARFFFFLLIIMIFICSARAGNLRTVRGMSRWNLPVRQINIMI